MVMLLAAAPIPDWQSPLGHAHPLVGTIWDVRTGTPLTPEVLQELPYEAIVRMKINADDPRLGGRELARGLRRGGRL